MKKKITTFKTCDNIRISCAHTIAKTPKSIDANATKKVVLWLHGITVNKDEYLDFFKDGANYLKQYSIDSLRIDFRGHGKSLKRSRGTQCFTIAGQIIDATTAVERINAFYSNNNVDLYVVGCSFGAPPAIYAAIQYKFVKKVILIAPVLSYQETFLQPTTEWASKIFTKNAIEMCKRTNELYMNDDFSLGRVLLEEMALVKPEIDISKVSKKILVIHGEKDSMVPYRISKNICNKYKVPLTSMPDMDHGFTSVDDEDGLSEQSQRNKISIYEAIYNETK